MLPGRKRIIAVVALAVVVAGGYGAARLLAQSKLRRSVENGLETAGLAETVSVGSYRVEPLSGRVRLSDLRVKEDGTEGWRAEAVDVERFESSPKAKVLTARLVGLRFAFADWIRTCKESRKLCPLAEQSRDMVAQGIDEIVGDFDLDYRMDEAAKRFRLTSRLHLRDYMDVGMRLDVGGLDTAAFREIGGWIGDAGRAGIPPMLLGLALVQGIGKVAEKIELNEAAFAVTDRGMMRIRTRTEAKAAGDTRPEDEILHERIAALQADLRGAAGDLLPAALREQMAAALPGFAFAGKPLRIGTKVEAPVVLLRRTGGTNALEPGPAMTDIDAAVSALGLGVGNAPL